MLWARDGRARHGPRLEVSWYLHGMETDLILEASGALRRTKHGPNGPLKWEGDVGPG